MPKGAEEVLLKCPHCGASSWHRLRDIKERRGVQLALPCPSCGDKFPGIDALAQAVRDGMESLP